MALIFLGLVGSALLYLAAIYGIEWSSLRRVRGGDGSGIAVDAPMSFPTAQEILRRHSVEWAVGFALFFVLLAIADFPLWQRLGVAGVLAIAFGSMWLSQSEPGSAAEAAPSFQRMGSNIWYWLLAVFDWLGFLGVLCFATELLVRPF